MHAGRGADHVGDRVEGTDLVEVHLVVGGAVRLGLGTGQPGEDVERLAAYGLVQVRSLEERTHVRPRPVLVARRDLHVDAGRSEAGAPDLRRDQPHRLDPDRVDRGLQHVERRSGADQRAERHVAAGSGRHVEPRDAVLNAHARTPARRATRAANTPAPKPLSMLQTVTPGAQELSIASSAARPP